MSYKLRFTDDAKREWDKLDHVTRNRFSKKLSERLNNPRVPAARLSGQSDRYKIKLQSIGYRLIYEVRDNILTVIVISIGKREKLAAYKTAARRTTD